MLEESISHVLSRWPEQRDRFEKLFQVDHRFREACEDYQELACWIEKNENMMAQRLENTCQLLEELAQEITDRLADQDEPIS